LLGPVARVTLSGNMTNPLSPGRALKVIITGATGMVGEGVLLECLAHPDVSEIVVINRKPGGVSDPKLREIIHADFFDLAPIESQLRGYDACFFCLGTSSVGMSKGDYKRVTYDLTLHLGELLAKASPALTFCYVTGAGTDSSEKGSTAWSNVKGATENALLRLFGKAYMFRPAMMKASAGQQNTKTLYKLLAWIYPIGRALYPAGFCTLHEVGRAMIHVAQKGYAKRVLEVADIVEIARLP
jgi:nucleoside-diphosphate-sugar epimerase